MELTFKCPHNARLQITVGYDFEREGYYVLVQDIYGLLWNERIDALLDLIQIVGRGGHQDLEIHSLHEATVNPLLDDSMESKGPLAVEEVLTILAMISDAKQSDYDRIINLKERKH